MIGPDELLGYLLGNKAQAQELGDDMSVELFPSDSPPDPLIEESLIEEPPIEEPPEEPTQYDDVPDFVNSALSDDTVDETADEDGDGVPDFVQKVLDDVPPLFVLKVLGDTGSEQSGQIDPKLYNKLLQSEGVSAGDAAYSTAAAAKKFMVSDDSKGWFERTIYALTLPEQMVARQLVNVLEETTDQMTPEDARAMLARDELHGADLVNFYWRKNFGEDDSFTESALRWGSGFLADLIIDPLSYLGIGAITKAGRTATVAGKTLSNLNRVSTAERNFYKSLEKIEKIITTDGKVVNTTDVVKNPLEENLNLLAQTRDKKLDFNDFLKSVELSDPAKNAVRDTFREGMTSSFGRDLVEGNRGLTFGINIPFTRVGWETDLPLSRWLSESQGAVLTKILSPMASVVKNKIYDKDFLGGHIGGLVNIADGIFTKTGKLLFDDQTNRYFGDIAIEQRRMQEFAKRHKSFFGKTLKNLTPDEQSQLLTDIVDELEFRPYTPDQALEMMRERGLDLFENKGRDYVVNRKVTQETVEGIDPRFRAEVDDSLAELRRNFAASKNQYDRSVERLFSAMRKAGMDEKDFSEIKRLAYEARDNDMPWRVEGYFDSLKRTVDKVFEERYAFTKVELSPNYRQLVEPTARDIERARRLSAHPHAMSFIDEAIALNDEMVAEYKKRGLPFEELNPFGPGWARRYMKHVVSDQWYQLMKKNGKRGEELIEAMRAVKMTGKDADKSAMGRKYRGGIVEANLKSLEEFGEKLFIDDPMDLVTRRTLEMRKIMASHDLMESASHYAIKNKNPGAGWVEFNPEHFKRLILDESNEDFDKWRAFVPEYYSKAMAAGETIYLPADIYDRMLYRINGHETVKFWDSLFAGADTAMRVWRSAALYGTDYLGLNFFSNLMQHITFNGLDAVDELVEATALLGNAQSKKVYKVVNEVGEKMDVPASQLLEEAIERNIINSGQSVETSFRDVAKNIATTYSQRRKVFGKIATVADWVYTYGMNRKLSEMTDNIFKLGTYIHRRAHGFSADAAAELAERYFYNYNNISRTQDAVRKVIPFATFPIKTMDMLASEFKDGKLGALTIPGKVAGILDGEFVEDKELDDVLDEQLPHYRQIVMHPIHGELLPGMREMTYDMPWAATTLEMVFSPDINYHPIMQFFNLVGLTMTNDEYKADTNRENMNRLIGSFVDPLIPPWMREIFIVGEINGAIDFGGFFSGRTNPTLPSGKDIMDPGGVEIDDVMDESRFQQFENAVNWGKAVDEAYGGDFFYDLLFPPNQRLKDGSHSDNLQQAQRGEYIRQRVRSMTLGLASMEKMDKNFFFNYFALQRRIRNREEVLMQELVAASDLVDRNKALSLPALQKSMHPEARELLSLHRKRESLAAYYDWYLNMQENFPGLLESVMGEEDGKNMFGNEMPSVDSELYEYYATEPEDIEPEAVDHYLNNLGNREQQQ